jgi:hypothetical protein
MSKQITFKYSPEENRRRILMDKHTKYVVVEGEEDIPKYESFIRSLSVNANFVPLFIGGKEGIKSLISSNKNTNFMAIADRDFNEDTMPQDARLIIISRYSIENFIFCPNVLNPLIANLTHDSEINIANWFNLEDWKANLTEKLGFLLKALYYYQTTVTTNRKSWSTLEFLNNNCWSVSEVKTDGIIKNLYDNSVPEENIESVEKFGEINNDVMIKYFPGKLLLLSLYRFIKAKFTEKFNDSSKLTKRIGNQSSLVLSASAYLHRQNDLRDELSAVLEFVLSG